MDMDWIFLYFYSTHNTLNSAIEQLTSIIST